MTRYNQKHRPVLLAATLGLAALALAGCQTDKANPTAGGGGLAGRWTPDGGGYTAEFDNGRFTTIANDTQNVISQGGYLAISEKQVDLNWTSNVTGLPNTATCTRPDLNTLDCKDTGGKGFVLRRS
jgi:hypothetical protein